VNIVEIKQKFLMHSALNGFVAILQMGGQKAFFKNLQGSGAALLAGALSDALPQNFLVLLPEEEEAEFFKSDLENLELNKSIIFLPDSYKKPFDFENLVPDKIRLRTEALEKIKFSTKSHIIVTHLAALAEKVYSAEELESNTLKLEENGPLDVDFLMEMLYDLGFEKEDFVFEPGHFALRGAIIDIFSYGSEHPYRIELDGNTIESIRSFDAISQLSIKTHKWIKIVPDMQHGNVNVNKISFFEYLKPNTLVWVKDPQLQEEALQNLWQSHQEKGTQGIEELLLDYTQIQAKLEALNTIEFGISKHENYNFIATFNQKAQPIFGKNFDMALNHLKENEVYKIQNILFSEQPRQIERIWAILRDKQREISFFPVYHALGQGFVDLDLQLACYTEHQLFNRFFRYKNKKSTISKDSALTLKELKELKPGDFVTHVDHGVGKFAGLQKMDNNGRLQEVVRIVYRDNDMLFVSINSLHKLSRFSGKDGAVPSLHKLGSGVWEKQKASTKKKVKDIARELIKLYAARKAQKGFAFAPDSYLQTELEASFFYEDTPDQATATEQIKKDMESPIPMDRLLCGDVGFGKTEVAIRAAFKAVCDSKQVAILVPTTILAHQHYRTFSQRLEGFPCSVDFINRFKSSAEQKATLKRVAEGKTDILIGTHRILAQDVKFKNLGLLIIDEEQKFGVSAKEKLRHLRVSVDTLTLTATPIPRTLHFSLMGARDLSVINTPPPNRYPIQTELYVFNKEVIKEAIEREVARGGQVFFVHNRVKDIGGLQAMIEDACPGIRTAMAHGQMEGNELEKIMVRFIEGEYDVLVSTSIIETGLDIPNGNTIIINNAHTFGLSDLHQMRGRVGRSHTKAFCLLLSPPLSSLTADARKRLRTLEEFSDLGSGFQIAMRDLDIRGAGNLLGGEQSGFISEIGFDMYHKILDEAISELKEDEFKELFADREISIVSRDCQVDTDFEMLIPDDYVSQIAERLSLYQELALISNDKQLQDFTKNLEDRFGKIPPSTLNLLQTVKIKWLGKALGFEKINLSGNSMQLWFPSNPNASFFSSPQFSSLLMFITQSPAKFEMKQTPKSLRLIVNYIPSVSEAVELLLLLQREVYTIHTNKVEE
jgi:transcription-repair coupling factor (superfamily II helicase)